MTVVRDYTFAQCEEDYRRALLFCLLYPVVMCSTLDTTDERARALVRTAFDRSLSAIEDTRAAELIP